MVGRKKTGGTQIPNSNQWSIILSKEMVQVQSMKPHWYNQGISTSSNHDLTQYLHILTKKSLTLVNKLGEGTRNELSPMVLLQLQGL